MAERPIMYNQNVYSTHLVMSILILLLTVYPYLFNNVSTTVAAFSSKDFQNLHHRMIDAFDLIQTDDIIESKSISTRDTREQNLSHEQAGPSQIHQRTRVKRLHFSSLSRTFDLILHQPVNLLTDDFTVVTLDAYGRATKVPVRRDDVQILNGYVAGDDKSSATASLNKHNKLMTAQIKTGDNIYIVEPIHLHSESLVFGSTNETDALPVDSASKLYKNTMIVYNLRDHKHFHSSNNNSSNDDNLTSKYPYDLKELCDYVDLQAETKENELSDPLQSEHKRASTINNTLDGRRKRGIEFLNESARDRTRCTLHIVADYLFYKHVGNSDNQTTINYVLALINRVNLIYLPTSWNTGDGDDEFTNIGFTVQNITIHQEYTRTSSSSGIHYNMQSDRLWTARDFLDNFSRFSPPRHYCLAHLLTYRQFDTPVLGLAYVASTRYGTIGGICSPAQQKGDHILKHNTGISTSKGISGETLISRQADLVVAHELGHNLGAEHDTSECRPSPYNGGAYLMHPFSVLGFERNNRLFSECSRTSIGKVIRRKGPTCFVAVLDHICGNGIVEDDEECDGGEIGRGHSDPCCDASCRFTPGAQCSDRDPTSVCCSKCRIIRAGIKCREPEQHNCKQEAYCDGRLAICPASPPTVDDQVCIGRGLCRSGECMPFCEARELHSCLCSDSENACRLCCKTSLNGTCVPYDRKSAYLPDGILCYRGVCEKGRCEQPIQDVVERLWDIIEDVSLSSFYKFLRDNIILVVLAVSIPLWCICAHLIDQWDTKIKRDVINSLIAHRNRRKGESHSAFMPALFVGDELSLEAASDPNLAKGDHLSPSPSYNGRPHSSPVSTGYISPMNKRGIIPPPHKPVGFMPPEPGFQMMPLNNGEDVGPSYDHDEPS